MSRAQVAERAFKKSSTLAVAESPKRKVVKAECPTGLVVTREGMGMAHVIDRLERLEVSIGRLVDILSQEEHDVCSIGGQVEKLALKK